MSEINANSVEEFKVLIVDDEPNMATAIQRTLRAAGFGTRVANSGLEAGIFLHYSVPDVITLDLRMPEMDGGKVLGYMKDVNEYVHVKVLVVTGMSDQDLQSMDLTGADGVLRKPFENNELVEKVRELVVG